MKAITYPNNTQFQAVASKAAFVLMVCSLLWGINFIDRQILAAVLEPMREDLGLSDAQAGWITSALLLGMALFAIPTAYWSDRWSRKKAIGIMAIFWSLTTGLTGLCRSAETLFVMRLLTGAGQAGFSAAAMALISTSFPENIRAKKLGIFNLFQIIGIFIGYGLGGYISAHWGGWRMPFFYFAIPGVVLGFCAFFMQDDSVPNASPRKDDSQTLFRNIVSLVKVPTIAWFYAGYAFYIAVSFSVLAWMPSLLIRWFGITESVAGFIMAGATLFTIPGVLIGGIVADRWQTRHPAGRMRFATLMVLLSTLGIMGAILIVFTGQSDSISLFTIRHILGGALLALFCATSAAVNPAVMAATQTVAPKNKKSLVWGLGLFIMLACGGAWSPMVTGLLSEVIGADARALALSLVLTCALGFAGTVCLWRSASHYPTDAIVER